MDYYNIDVRGRIKVQRVPTLPAWTSSDEGRMVYSTTDKKYYFGNNSTWTEMGVASTLMSSGLTVNQLSVSNSFILPIGQPSTIASGMIWISS